MLHGILKSLRICSFKIFLFSLLHNWWASLVTQMVKNPPRRWEMGVWSLGLEYPLEEGMATHSTLLAWRIPWTEEPGGLQSTRSQRVGHAWATKQIAQIWGMPFQFVIYLSTFCIFFGLFLPQERSAVFLMTSNSGVTLNTGISTLKLCTNLLTVL